MTDEIGTHFPDIYVHVCTPKSILCYDTVFHWQAYEVIECIEAYVPVVAPQFPQPRLLVYYAICWMTGYCLY